MYIGPWQEWKIARFMADMRGLLPSKGQPQSAGEFALQYDALAQQFGHDSAEAAMRLRSVWDQQSRPNAFRDVAEVGSERSTRGDSAALPSIRRRAASSGGIASDVRPSKLKARSSKAAQISAQARIEKMRAVYGIQRETDADADGTGGHAADQSNQHTDDNPRDLGDFGSPIPADDAQPSRAASKLQHSRSANLAAQPKQQQQQRNVPPPVRMFDNAPIVYSQESLAYDPNDKSSSFFLPSAGSDMGTKLMGTSAPLLPPQSFASTVRISGSGDVGRFDSKYTHPSLAHHARPPTLETASQSNNAANHRNTNAKLARGSVAAAAAHLTSNSAKSSSASPIASPKTAPAAKSSASADQSSVQSRMMPHSGLFFAPVASASELASTVPAPKNLNHALAFPHKPGAAVARAEDKSVLSHLTTALAQHRQLYTRFEERGMVEEHQRQRLAEQAQRHKELHQQEQMRQKMSPQRPSQQAESTQLNNRGRQRTGSISAQINGLGPPPSHVFRNGHSEFVDDESEPIEWGRAPRKPHASVKQPVDTMSASANSQTVGSFPMEESSGLGFGGMGVCSFPPMPFPQMPFPFPPPSADGTHPFTMPPYPFPMPGSADFAASLQLQQQQHQSHGANQQQPQMMMMMVPMMPPGSTDLPPPAFFPLPMPSGPGAGLQWPQMSMLPQLPPATPVSGLGFDSTISQSRQQQREPFPPQPQQPHRNAPAASSSTAFPKPLVSPLRVGNASSSQQPRQQPQVGSLLPMLPSVAVPESMIHSHESSHTPKALGGQPNFAIGQSSMVRRLVPTLAASPQNKQQPPQQQNQQSQPLRSQSNSQYQFGDRPSIGLGPNVWQSKDPINSAQSTARSLTESNRAISSSLPSPLSSTSSATPTVHPTLRISRSTDDPSPSNVIWASQDFDIDGAGAVNPSPSPQSIAVHSARPPPVISSHRDQAGGHTRIQAALPPSSQIQPASTVPKSLGPQIAQPQSKLPSQSQAVGVFPVGPSLPRPLQQPQRLSAKPASSRLRSAVQSPGRGADSDVEREVDNLIDWSNELDLDDSL